MLRRPLSAAPSAGLAFAASDSPQPLASTRQGDSQTVTFGSDERYEVPNALLSGG